MWSLILIGDAQTRYIKMITDFIIQHENLMLEQMIYLNDEMRAINKHNVSLKKFRIIGQKISTKYYLFKLGISVNNSDRVRLSQV